MVWEWRIQINGSKEEVVVITTDYNPYTTIFNHSRPLLMMILDIQYELCKSHRDWVPLFCWVKCMALRNGNWIELKYDMILGGIFNIWRYLTYSPPLRPCTAGLDVAKTRRLGVTCSRINSSSGNYGITSSTPPAKNSHSYPTTPQECQHLKNVNFHFSAS